MLRIVKIFLILAVIASFADLPARSSASGGPILLQGFPLLRQGHSLTCEASAASMATLGQLAERQIMAVMPRNPNPNLGFRGSPDGQQGTALVDYGVYAMPLQKVLLQYGYHSELIYYGSDAQLRSYIDRGWSVVTWVTYRLQRAVPRLAWAGGSQFFLVPHEHVVLVIGYDANGLIANDPWTAKQVRYDWGNFNRAWGYFANMGLAIEPCQTPQPVTSIRADGPSDLGETWSWSSPNSGSTYHVRIIRHGKRDRVVYDATQSSRSYTLASPSPGAVYEVVVTTLSPCGDASAPRNLFTLIPSTPTPSPAAKTPTPTASPSTTPASQVTPTTPPPAATSTPTPTASPTPTAAP